MSQTEPPEPVRQAAIAWLQGAWVALHEQHVLPTSRYRRHLRVGHDFYGVLDQALYDDLESAVQEHYPRFRPDLPLHEREFASQYLFSLLGAVIADAPSTSSRELPLDHVDTILAEFHDALCATDTTVACLRLVTHVTTNTQTPLDLGGVTVTPVISDSAGTSGTIAHIFESAIHGAAETLNRLEVHVYAPPESVLAKNGDCRTGVSGRGVGHDSYATTSALSADLDRWLLAVRLLRPTTCQSAYEIQGEIARIRWHAPHHATFRGAGPGFASPTGLLCRTARLEPGDDAAIVHIQQLLSGSSGPDSDMAFTSLGLAVHKFTMSFHAHAWYEQLVDLATALEGALAGSDSSDVTLRLRSRAAALLNTSTDPAGSIFNDTKTLYEIRSKLVHGNSLNTKTLRKNISKLSTARSDDPYGVALARAVDRLRDLVRRALLARLTLATTNPPKWLLDEDTGVDAALADDTTRTVWRTAWQQALRDAGAQCAPDAARPADDSLTAND